MSPPGIDCKVSGMKTRMETSFKYVKTINAKENNSFNMVAFMAPVMFTNARMAA